MVKNELKCIPNSNGKEETNEQQSMESAQCQLKTGFIISPSSALDRITNVVKFRLLRRARGITTFHNYFAAGIDQGHSIRMVELILTRTREGHITFHSPRLSIVDIFGAGMSFGVLSAIDSSK